MRHTRYPAQPAGKLGAEGDVHMMLGAGAGPRIQLSSATSVQLLTSDLSNAPLCHLQGLAALTPCHMPSCLLALPAEGGSVRVYDVARGGSTAGTAGGGVDVLCELEAHKAPVVRLVWGWVGRSVRACQLCRGVLKCTLSCMWCRAVCLAACHLC